MSGDIPLAHLVLWRMLCSAFMAGFDQGHPNPYERLARMAADNAAEDYASAALKRLPAVDMVLHCPNCFQQHVDAEEPHQTTCIGVRLGEGCDCNRWTNPPHRSHKCHACAHVWRPADVATNGVLQALTKGTNDHPVPPIPAAGRHPAIYGEQTAGNYTSPSSSPAADSGKGER